LFLADRCMLDEVSAPRSRDCLQIGVDSIPAEATSD
jgi:hypothetical protein